MLHDVRAQTVIDHGKGFVQRKPLAFLHLPVPESAGGGVLDDAATGDFIVDLISHLRAGEVLYVHDSEGNGRTGVVCAVIVGLLYGMSSAEAIDYTQRARNSRFGASGAGPDTHKQRLQVHRYVRACMRACDGVSGRDVYRARAHAHGSLQSAGVCGSQGARGGGWAPCRWGQAPRHVC